MAFNGCREAGEGPECTNRIDRAGVRHCQCRRCKL